MATWRMLCQSKAAKQHPLSGLTLVEWLVRNKGLYQVSYDIAPLGT